MSVISEKVKASNDLTEIPDYYVPEWDVKLLLISPTVEQRLAMIEQYTVWSDDPDGPVATLDRTAMGPSLVIACAHDPENREPAFVEADVTWLKGKNGAVVERIAQKCFPLVGFGDEPATEAGKGDSSTTPSEGTVSALLVDSAAR